jgi:hypothetical protein
MKNAPDRIALGCRAAWLCLLAGAFSGLGAAGQETNTTGRPDYGAFRVVSERNIFNASRSGRWASPPPSEERRSSRVDSFTLVGTMAYGKGPFAFFDGTSSDYRKVLPPGGTIGGCTVADIAAGQVRLQAESNRFELKVGMQLRREDEGPWHVSESAGTYASSGGRSEFGRGDSRGFDSRRGDSRGNDPRRGGPRRNDSRNNGSTETVRPSAPSTPSAPAPKLSAEEESEILKRLMQKRDEESK